MAPTLKSCRFFTTQGNDASRPTATVTFGSGSGISGLNVTDEAPFLKLGPAGSSAARRPVKKIRLLQCLSGY